MVCKTANTCSHGSHSPSFPLIAVLDASAFSVEAPFLSLPLDLLHYP